LTSSWTLIAEISTLSIDNHLIIACCGPNHARPLALLEIAQIVDFPLRSMPRNIVFTKERIKIVIFAVAWLLHILVQ
jgi:hypothetical protein